MRKKIKKVSVAPIDPIEGAVSDTINVADKVKNAPSINLVQNMTGIPQNGVIYYDGEVVPEGYEEVTSIGFEVYSTTEQVIGTWIDGKPLYRKVIEATTPSSANNASPIYSCGSLNIDIVTNISGTIVGAEMCWSLNAHASAEYTSVVYYHLTEQKMFSQVGSALISLPCKMIIEYTKTTD